MQITKHDETIKFHLDNKSLNIDSSGVRPTLDEKQCRSHRHQYTPKEPILPPLHFLDHLRKKRLHRRCRIGIAMHDHQINELHIDTPITNSCGNKGTSCAINCGNTATMKMMPLGLVALVRNPVRTRRRFKAGHSLLPDRLRIGSSALTHGLGVRNWGKPEIDQQKARLWS